MSQGTFIKDLLPYIYYRRKEVGCLSNLEQRMKILISDLDGTLYPTRDSDDQQWFPRNKEAVLKWIKTGNRFAVATARSIGHYSVLCEKLGFNVDYIGGNGAEVILETGEEILKEMPMAIFIDLCNFIIENGINASVMTIDDGWQWSSIDCYPIKNASTYRSVWDHIKLADLGSMDPEKGIHRIMILTPPEERDNLKEIIASRNYDAVISSSDIDSIDIVPPNCSKGIAIKELCKRYQVDPSNVIVVGDSENDIAMLEVTKNSYAMINAEKKVQQKATYITQSVAELINIELDKDK